MNYKAVCEVRDGEIVCEAISADADENAEYAYYLYRDGELYQKQMYIRETSFTFSPWETGTYHVRLFVRLKTGETGECRWEKVNSNAVQLLESDLLSRRLREEAENAWSLEAEQLPFYHRKEPYSDFCLIYGYQPDGLADMGQEEGLYYHVFSRFSGQDHAPCVMLSSAPVVRTPTCDLFFSGIGRTDATLILGQRDAERLQDPRVLRDTIGQFSMIYQDSEKIYIGCDYFGIGKLYYYRPEGENRIVISNRYQLLIMALKYLRVSLSLNQNKWLADLYHIGQVGQQIFSRDMEIDHTFLLPIDRCFEITGSGCAEIPSEIDAVLHNPGELDMDEYPKLLRQAANEIIDNIRIVYQSPFVKYVSVDATGGLDTRVTLSAWSNLTDADRRDIPTRYYTSMTLKNQENRKIGIEIGEMAGLHLQAWSVKKSWLNAEKEYLKALSCYYGEYYLFKAERASSHVDGLINLTGFFGESCCRLYYAREKMFRGGGEYENMNQMIRRLSKPGAAASRIDDPDLMSAWKRELTRELELMPGFSPSERWDLHYLFNRNRIHCHKEFAPEYGNPIWGPIMSKTAFRLKMMSYHVFPELKLELDLIELLNPEIGAIRYELPIDEAARNRLHETGQALSERQTPDSSLRRETPDFDMICENYKRELRENTKTVNSKDRLSCIEQNAEFDNRLLSLFRRALPLVLDAIGDKLSKTSREAALKWVEQNILSEHPSQQKSYFINKILYLYYLRNLFFRLESIPEDGEENEESADSNVYYPGQT